MQKIITCNSCGAQFSSEEPKCPYCGTIHYEGAEQEYLEKLEDVREDMEELKDVSSEETKKEFVKQGKFIKRIILICIIIAVIFTVPSILMDKMYERDKKADIIWKSENYSIMDEMYEAGEYEELAVFFKEALMEDKPVYDWEHYAFMDTYICVEAFYETQEYLEREESLDKGDYTIALWEQLRVIAYSDNTLLTEEEKAYFAEDFQIVEDHLKNDWGFNEETYQEFYYEAVEKEGYVQYTKCEEYIEEWLKGKK